jgi:hypothetical protein
MDYAGLDKAISQFVSRSNLTAARGFGRALPLLGYGLLAYELWSLWGEDVPAQTGGFDTTGWTVNCGGPGPAWMATGVNCGGSPAAPDAAGMKVQRTDIGSGNYAEQVNFGQGLQPLIPGFIQFNPPPSIGLLTRVVNLGPGAQTGPVDAPMAPDVPGLPARWAPAVRPLTYPSIDPMVLPINQPVFDPGPVPFKDLPYREPNPWRNPEEQPQRGPRPRPRPRPSDWTAPRVPTITVDSTGDIAVSPPTGHVYRPPPKQSKEKKIRISTGGTLLRIAFDHLTEADDLVDAFWWALPKGARTKVPQVRKKDRYYGVKYQTPKLGQKLADLYKGWDKVDWNKAIDNAVMNEIGDRVAGKIGRASGQAAASTGRPVGYQLGPVF